MNKYQKVAVKIAKKFDEKKPIQVSIQSCARRILKQSKHFEWSIEDLYNFKKLFN